MLRCRAARPFGAAVPRAVALLAVALLDVALPWAPPVMGQLDSLVVNFTNREMWRGYQFGSGFTSEAALDVGVLGHPRTFVGWFGLRAHGEAKVPVSDRSDARKAGEHYGLGVETYACLNGSSCEWSVRAGFDEFFRPHDPSSVSSSPEVNVSIHGQVIFQASGVGLYPSVTVRRDFEAFDGWMSEARIANVLGRGDKKVVISGIWRLSDYQEWGSASGEFGSHSGEVAASFQKAQMFTDKWLVSWTWLAEVGGSFAADGIGDNVFFVRVGVGVIH